MEDDKTLEKPQTTNRRSALRLIGGATVIGLGSPSIASADSESEGFVEIPFFRYVLV